MVSHCSEIGEDLVKSEGMANVSKTHIAPRIAEASVLLRPFVGIYYFTHSVVRFGRFILLWTGLASDL